TDNFSLLAISTSPYSRECTEFVYIHSFLRKPKTCSVCELLANSRCVIPRIGSARDLQPNVTNSNVSSR
mgnify:CR=1